MILFLGSGRLTAALVSFLKPREVRTVGLYSRNDQTAKELVDRYSWIHTVTPEAFPQATDVFVCLPKGAYEAFFAQYGGCFSSNTRFYCLATALLKKEARSIIPTGTIILCKVVGHARQMIEDEHALIVVEKEEPTLKLWFNEKVTITVGDEKDVLRANTLATKETLVWIASFRQQLQKQQIPADWHDHILEQTVRGVIKAYVNDDLGDFAKSTMKQKESDDENR